MSGDLVSRSYVEVVGALEGILTVVMIPISLQDNYLLCPTTLQVGVREPLKRRIRLSFRISGLLSCNAGA